MKLLRLLHHKGLLAAVWLSMALYGTTNIALAFLLMSIVDAVTTNQWELFSQTVVAALGLVVFEFVIGMISQYLQERFGTREAVLQKELRFRKRLLDTGEVGGDIAAFSTDIDLLYNNCFVNLGRIAYDVTQLVLATASILFLSWKIALVVAVSIVLPFVVPMIFQKALQRSTKNYQEASGRYLAFVQDASQGLEEIRTYRAFSFFFARHNTFDQQAEDTRLKNKMWLAFNNSAAAFVSTLSFVVIMAFCGYLCLTGESTLGAMIAVIQLMNSVIGPISTLSGEIGGIQSTQKLLLNEADFPKEQPEDSSGVGQVQTLVAQKLSYSYDNEHIVLKDISLRLERGNRYALVGESGIGKSTLAKLLAGRLTPSSGQVLLLDKKGCPLPGNLALRVQYVSQEPYVFALTPKENVYLGQAGKDGVLRQLLDQLLIGQLADADTLTLRNREGISGGQKQRLVIARALTHPADVLILDEPTANLDSSNALKVMQCILKAKAGIVVVITHDTRPEILKLFDQVIPLG